MRFFFDNCISPKLARALNELVKGEHEVIALRQKWPNADTQTIEDTAWINTLGKEGGWVVVSGDIQIRHRPAEAVALRTAKLTTFFLAKGYTSATKWDQVVWLIEKWPKIVELADRTAPGSLFLVPKNGKIGTI